MGLKQGLLVQQGPPWLIRGYLGLKQGLLVQQGPPWLIRGCVGLRERTLLGSDQDLPNLGLMGAMSGSDMASLGYDMAELCWLQ